MIRARPGADRPTLAGLARLICSISALLNAAERVDG